MNTPSAVPYTVRMPLFCPNRASFANPGDYQEAMCKYEEELVKRLAYVTPTSSLNLNHDFENEDEDEDDDDDDDNDFDYYDNDFDFEENPLLLVVPYKTQKCTTEELQTCAGECSICLENMTRSNCVTTNCMHSYCGTCYNKYKKPTCPLCRQPVLHLTKYAEYL